MKKILKTGLGMLFVLCALSSSADARNIDCSTTKNCYLEVTRVGTKILNDNQITKHMNFDVSYCSTLDPSLDQQYVIMDRSQHSLRNDRKLYNYREISLWPPQMRYIETEDELAAILAHEIAHGVHSYEGWFSGSFRYLIHDYFFFNAKRTDRKLDKRAVDYMVKAGYDPIALIAIINKQRGEKRTDWYLRTTKTSKKMFSIYKYIRENYPQYLETDNYKDNIYIQNFMCEADKNIQKYNKKLEKKKSRAWD